MKAEELFRHASNVPQEKKAALIEHARLFLTSDEYRPCFTEREIEALRPFFTNVDGRVFFIHSLPEVALGMLLSMYSRLKNKRGLRGTFVDSFLPYSLANFLTKVAEKFQGKAGVFLEHYNINSLDAFVRYSEETKCLFKEFKEAFSIDPDYLRKFTDSPRIKAFHRIWLDKFGHNSIARPSKITLCSENVSVLAAKSFEWTRPGSGYIELSTRFVSMSGKGFYPIQNELAEFGVEPDEALNVICQSFDEYKRFQGENFNGILPRFLRERYDKKVPDPKDLENGVIGETCDVLGNFLPCATLTSLGISVSGEAFPQLLKHLILDDTPENLVLVEMILKEAGKLGYDQFARHFEPTEREKSDWQYLDCLPFVEGCFDSAFHPSRIINASLMPDDKVRGILYQGFSGQPGFKDSGSFSGIVIELKKIHRSEFDKLPGHFENISAVFSGKMSFRSWRDLQRQQLATHYRTYVTPTLGFYSYDKPIHLQLPLAFREVWLKNLRLYGIMQKAGIPAELMQYPMAMGNLIGFRFGGNLREIEFCSWQRTKFSVNHEVRQIFLKIEEALHKEYLWWPNFSRANMTPAFIFARTNEGIPLI